MALNLEKQLTFYGQYHHNPVTNIAIHTVCVPLILFTGILLGTNAPPLYPLPEWASIPHMPPNIGTLFAFLFSSLYILMEPVAGGLAAPIILGTTALSNYLTSHPVYAGPANNIATVLQVGSWIAQFVGHGKFEGRAPALLDNIVQAIFLAPFFVWMEVLFKFGYRVELKKRLDGEVEREIEKYRKEKEKGGGKEGNGEVVNGKAK